MNNANITQADIDKFFDKVQELVKDKIPYECTKPKDCCYCYFPTGKTHFEWYFDKEKNYLKICIHSENANKEKNKRFFDIICNFKDIIKENTEEKEVRDEEEPWKGIYIKKDSRELNEELKKWAADKMIIFYKTIKHELEETLKMLTKF